MATKKITSPAYKATAVFVTATIPSRCRAGIVFTKGKEQRLEIDKLPAGALAAIEADPYLKVTYEADELVEGEAASAAESRILELETLLAEKETALAAANKVIAELKEAATSKAKK